MTERGANKQRIGQPPFETRFDQARASVKESVAPGRFAAFERLIGAQKLPGKSTRGSFREADQRPASARWISLGARHSRLPAAVS